eukprot:361271-Chlamydomonas_euryale.AAC.5
MACLSGALVAKDGLQHRNATKDTVPCAMRGSQGLLMALNFGVREAFTSHSDILFGAESNICETAMQQLKQAAAGRHIDS